jgi:hypothetical protein
VKTNRLLLLSVLFLWAGLLNAKDLEFKQEPLRKGSLVQFSLQSDLRFFTGGLKASARMMAELFVLEADDDSVNKVKLSYGDCATEGTLPNFASDKSPVEGKVYIVERKAGKFSIQNAMGEEVSAAETAIVEKDLEFLGRPHPIAVMLSGQRLKIGDKLGQTDVLRQVLEERLAPYKVGKIKDVEAVLISQGVYNKEKTAVFAFKAETGESTVAYNSKFDLTGQLVVAIPTGRPIAVRLDGPVQATASQEAAKEELRGKTLRGTFSLVVLTQVFPGEMEYKHYTNDNDWAVPIGLRGGGGRR